MSTDIQQLAANVVEAAKLLAEAKEQEREASIAEVHARNAASGREKDLAAARAALDAAVNKVCGK